MGNSIPILGGYARHQINIQYVARISLMLDSRSFYPALSWYRMNFGVIGLGNHAINRMMPAIQSSGNGIASIYSRDLSKAKAESEKYGASAYDDLKQFLEKGNFEAVYIASPNFLHYSQARDSMLAGKHVLLEKPMTISNEDARDLVAISAKQKVSLAVGFHLRFHPAVAEIRKMLRENEIGEISFVQGFFGALSSPDSYTGPREWWGREEQVGGGSVAARGVHLIDAINYMLNDTPVQVQAARDPPGSTIDNTETVVLRYGRTIVVATSSRNAQHPRNDLMIAGTTGSIYARNLFGTTIDCDLYVNDKLVHNYSGGNMYEEEIKGFVEMVSGRKSAIASARDGELTVRIVNAASSADSKGNSVKI